jgi:LPS-assembly lipoprotein
MSLPDSPRFIRLVMALSLAALTGGCFQPLYGNSSVTGGNLVSDKMTMVEVAEIEVPKGTRLARVAVDVRNTLMFDMTGAGSAYRLDVKLSSGQYQVIVDINSGRPDIQNYGIDASYTLTDLTTKKRVVSASTLARVSYNIPGQLQRFAGDRGLRDAEDRAAKEIAENIRARLQSYFAAGT